MKLSDFVDLTEDINKAFPNSIIKRWVTEDTHEDIVVENEELIVKLKVYPKKKSDSNA